MTQLANTAKVSEIIASLQAVTGINNRAELAALIGGTALPTDNFGLQLAKLATIKQGLIDVVNGADANNDTVKTDIITKVNLALGTTLTNAATWTAIRAAIVKDADKVTGNIKAGVNIDGVQGKTEVVDTATALGALAAEIVTGKETFINGVKVIGTGGNAKRTQTGSLSGQAIATGQGFTYPSITGLPFTPINIMAIVTNLNSMGGGTFFINGVRYSLYGTNFNNGYISFPVLAANGFDLRCTNLTGASLTPDIRWIAWEG